MSAQNQATTTTIKKLPPIREDVPGMKLRIQEVIKIDKSINR